MRGFENRVAVVTGAAGGIGQATAARLSSLGAKVAVLDLDLTAAQKTASGLDNPAIGLQCDVSQRDQVEASMAEVAKEFGGIDILVSNAGITRDRMLFKMSDAEWNDVIAVHLTGSFLCAQVTQRYMVEKGYGRMVFLSSTSALGHIGQVNYATAKAGLQAMAKTLALELGRFGVTANAVAPGFIETEMTRAIATQTGVEWEAVLERARHRAAVGRTGKPEDVADAICYLAAETSGYVTGQVLYVAGRPTV